MKKSIIGGIIAFAMALIVPQASQAQGIVYLSNLGQPSAGSLVVGSNSWLAANFLTGTNAGGYALDSIQLGMSDASGTPSGFKAMLYNFRNTAPIPGQSLGVLDGSLNPAVGGIYTFTPATSLT